MPRAPKRVLRRPWARSRWTRRPKRVVPEASGALGRSSSQCQPGHVFVLGRGAARSSGEVDRAGVCGLTIACEDAPRRGSRCASWKICVGRPRSQKTKLVLPCDASRRTGAARIQPEGPATSGAHRTCVTSLRQWLPQPAPARVFRRVLIPRVGRVRHAALRARRP